MTYVFSSCAAAPPLPVAAGGAGAPPSPVQSPIQAPVQAGGAYGAPQQSPLQVPPSAVQAAAGGGELVQGAAASPVAVTEPQPVVAPAQPAAPATTQPQATGGGSSVDLQQLVPVLTQLVTVLTQVVGVFAAQAQAQAGAAAAQAAATGTTATDPAGTGATTDAEGGGSTGTTTDVAGGGSACSCGCDMAAMAVQPGASTTAGGASAAPVASDYSTGATSTDDGADEADEDSSPAAPAQLPSKKTTSRSQIDAYIKFAAKAYGADAGVLSNIAKYESSYRWNAVNQAAKSNPPSGMFQYKAPTFASLAPRARKANPDAWKGLGSLDHMDWRQQALTTAWAIEHGYASYWSTYKRAKREA